MVKSFFDEPAAPGHAVPSAVVLSCFAISGATGLVYEVVWVRMLGLVFGHTVAAITTVLVAFMAGLGAGAFAVGRHADRSTRRLRLYAVLEIAIGLTAFAVTAVAPRAASAYAGVFHGFETSPLVFAVGRFAVISVLLLGPTTLMGATLPVLSRELAGTGEDVGARIGLLYALNTAGAVAGTALAGYALLPALGMRMTVALSALANLLIGALVLGLDARCRRDSTPPLGETRTPTTPAPTTTVRLVGAALALSGAAAMTYEIAWTRGLALVIGSSTYAFTAMLVAFLGGIALGSAVAARLSRGRTVDATAFGLVQVSAAAAALAILPVFDRMPDLLVRTLALSVAPAFVLIAQLAMAIGAMLVPAALLGAAFPCAVALASPEADRVGTSVGRLYAANTLGAIAGTVAAGFLLMPVIGAEATVKTAVATNVAVGAAALVIGRASPGWRSASGAALALATLVGALLLPAWNPAAMASGVAVYANAYRRFGGRVTIAEAQADSRLTFYEDGLLATVTVHQRGAERFLRINGKTDASTGRDMHTQLMLGHLPLLLHPDARTALVIGLGSGVTAAAVARHPVRRIDVVEIEPAVVRASRLFATENRDVLGDRRVTLTVGDARNVLLGARRRWDVIVSEPSNPWIGGIAALYSQEFYALARSRLAPGGVMVQWVQGYGITPDDLRMIVRTFRSAFPATTIWYPNVRGDYLLAGRAAVRPIDLARVRAIWNGNAGLRADIARRGVASPYAFLADFLLAETDAARYAGGGPLNTDDRLPLEFSAPLAIHTDTEARNLRDMSGFRREPWPQFAPDSAAEIDRAHARYALGLVQLAKAAPGRAIVEFERALAAEPAHVPAMIALGVALARSGLPVRALDVLHAALRREPTNADAHLELSRVYRAQQLPDQALEHARRAAALAQTDPSALSHLATLLAERGLVDEAIEEYLAARSLAPDDVSIVDGLASAYLARGRGADAVRLLEDALAGQPTSERLLQRAGRVYLALGRHADAVTVLERAVAQAPTSGSARADLGAAYLGLGRLEPGVASLRRALALDPAQPAAQTLLEAVNGRVRGDTP